MGRRQVKVKVTRGLKKLKAQGKPQTQGTEWWSNGVLRNGARCPIAPAFQPSSTPPLR
jgi:hypothetical protein